MVTELVIACLVTSATFLIARALLAHPPSTWPILVGGRLLRHPLLAGLRSRLERALVRAGGEPAEAATILGASLLLFCAGTAFAPIAWSHAGAAATFFPLAAGALPLLRLRDRMGRRQRAIGKALPWTLDLLALAVEIGVDFNVALARVAERARPGPWTEELAATVRHLRVGATRSEALEALQERTGHPAVARFCKALVQADRLGTPLRRILASQAEDLRLERARLAEKLAGEAPVKLLAPLLVCIFPTVFLVLFGPIAFSILMGGGMP